MLGRDWSTQRCSGKHPRNPKYLPQQEVSPKIIEKNKYSIFMTNSVHTTVLTQILVFGMQKPLIYTTVAITDWSGR